MPRAKLLKMLPTDFRALNNHSCLSLQVARRVACESAWVSGRANVVVNVVGSSAGLAGAEDHQADRWVKTSAANPDQQKAGSQMGGKVVHVRGGAS